MCIGLCPKCLAVPVKLTAYHILPRRFYKRQQQKGFEPILHLCRKCHDAIEALIPERVKLEDEEYFDIARMFIGGNYD